MKGPYVFLPCPQTQHHALKLWAPNKHIHNRVRATLSAEAWLATVWNLFMLPVTWAAPPDKLLQVTLDVILTLEFGLLTYDCGPRKPK